jgi:hypothetical protein
MICDNCNKKFDCIEPCKKAIAWEDLDQKYYLKKYEAKGLGMNLFWRKDKK